MSIEQVSSGVRLDVWLWAARFYKTRSLARQAIERGQIQINDAACKPSRPMHVGDRAEIMRGVERFEIAVLALSGRRGTAAVAQALYLESESSRLARDAARAQRSAERAGYRAPPGKPDKRARRLIRALGDLDAN